MFPGCEGASSDSGTDSEEEEEELNRNDAASVLAQCAPDAKAEIDGIPYTPVPAGLFSAPRPASRSGGTAAFFKTSYAGPAGPQAERWGRSDDYWLAKDLARAVDELDFYEQLSTLGPEYKLLHRWTMEYGGVLSARCESDADNLGGLEAKPRELMLLRNLRDGMEQLRMLDVKIGSKTAVAGWQGKSKNSARKQAILDMLTNSKVQGFRLEGFDSPPEVLSTLQQGEAPACFTFLKPGKKTKRLKLQRLVALEFLLYFIDFSGLQDMESSTTQAGEATLHAIEYSEAILFDLIGQLAALCVDAQAMPAPQMWIGSSVALACESAKLPARGRALGALQARSMCAAAPAPSVPAAGAPLALVKVFDWGRSEMNTAEKHAKLNKSERETREAFWPVWQRGPLRLLYDAMVLYCAQFSHRTDSKQRCVSILVWDEDTYDPPDVIGRALLPLEPTDGRVTLGLTTEVMCGSVMARRRTPEVEVEIARGPAPADSRLAEIWHVTVHGASDLPRADFFSASDPKVEVIITSSEGCDDGPQAFTPVIYNDNQPEFGARLDFGIVRPDVFDSMFKMVSRTVGQEVTPSTLLQPAAQPAGRKAETDAFKAFVRGIPRFAPLVLAPAPGRGQSFLS